MAHTLFQLKIMPIMGGFEETQKIHENEYLVRNSSHVPITAYAMVDDGKKKCLSADMVRTQRYKSIFFFFFFFGFQLTIVTNSKIPKSNSKNNLRKQIKTNIHLFQAILHEMMMTLFVILIVF